MFFGWLVKGGGLCLWEKRRLGRMSAGCVGCGSIFGGSFCGKGWFVMEV